FFHCSPYLRHLHSFPTRRSSDLLAAGYGKRLLISGVHPTNAASDISRSLPDNQSLLRCCVDLDRSAINTRSNAAEARRWAYERGDRKSTRLNSSHVAISYAVFCL